MNCEKCETQKNIRSTLEQCAACPNREVRQLPGGGDELTCAASCPKIEALRNACLNCTNGKDYCGCASMGHGAVHIDFDLNGDTAPAWCRFDPDYLAARRPQQNRFLDSMPEGVGEYLNALVSAFAALELCDVEILHGLLNGMRCSEIADAFGYKNRAAVHARMRSAFARNPWMGDIYTFGVAEPCKRGAAVSKTWSGWKGSPMKRKFGKNARPLAADLPGVSADELADQPQPGAAD